MHIMLRFSNVMRTLDFDTLKLALLWTLVLVFKNVSAKNKIM